MKVVELRAERAKIYDLFGNKIIIIPALIIGVMVVFLPKCRRKRRKF